MASYRSALSQTGWLGSYLLDKDLYAQRYFIECCLSKLRQFREITHFEKTAQNNRAVVTVTAIVLWIK